MDINAACYERSIALLLENSSRYGFLAASPQKRAEKRNYLSIFARDASICALGAVASGNAKLIACAKKSLKNLAKYQAENGQMPNYVKPENGYTDFWRMGCIDAGLWWLIALDFYDKQTSDKNFKKSLKKKINKTISWLLAQEHPNGKLLIQNEASDWADLFPRSGKVLYANALWLKVKELYKINDLQKSRTRFNDNFYPFNAKTERLIRSDISTIKSILKTTKATNYLLSYVNYLYWGKDIDTYGNSLAIIFNLITKDLKAKISANFLAQKKIKNLPLPALFNPIKEDSRAWRPYMESHRQNYPYQYHNGGIWPYASCFWAMALYAASKKTEAKKELARIAYANSLNNWRFSEWFNAQTGDARGMRGQSWNAGAYLLAWHYIEGDIFF